MSKNIIGILLVFVQVFSSVAFALPPKDVEGRDFRAPLIIKDLSTTPAAPASGFQKIYPKGGKFYTQTSGGIEKLVGSGAGGGASSVLQNSGFEDGASTNWVLGSGTVAALNSSDFFEGIQSTTLTLTSVNGDAISQSLTPALALSGNNLEYAIRYKTALTTLSLCALAAGAELSCVSLPASTTWQQAIINFPAPSSGTSGLKLKTSSSTSGTVQIDDGYVGIARNIGSVSQATHAGRLVVPGGASCTWDVTSGTFASFPANSNCGTPTGTGYFTATAGKIPGGAVSNLPPGEYTLTIRMAAQQFGADSVNGFRVTDGTNVSDLTTWYPTAGTNAAYPLTLQAHFTYTTAQPALTFQVQGYAGSGTIRIHNSGSASFSAFSMELQRFPITSEQAVRQSANILPKITVFTSSSTYIPTPGAVSTKFRVYGGGGGGSSGGPTFTTFGGSGSTSSVIGNGVAIQAGGGAGGTNTSGGSGGTPVLTNAQGFGLTGGSGMGTGYTNTAQGAVGGGSGASSPLGGAGGGAGGGGSANTGGSAIPNSGSGGGGGSVNNAATGASGGGGGGAGAYAEGTVNNPGTMTVTVGGGGAGGTGTSSGGPGGTGLVVAEESFGVASPLVIGSVTSNSSGLERVERIRGTGAGALAGGSSAWINTAPVKATGGYTYAIQPGIFSATPDCFCTVDNTTAHCTIDSITATAFRVVVRIASTQVLTDSNHSAFCMGPR